jgi:hypothetical protein
VAGFPDAHHDHLAAVFNAPANRLHGFLERTVKPREQPLHFSHFERNHAAGFFEIVHFSGVETVGDEPAHPSP